MGAMAAQITGVSIVYSTVCSGADHRKHQSFAPLSFVRGIHRVSNAESVSILWRHHVESSLYTQTQEPRRFAIMFTHIICIQIYLMSLHVIVLILIANYHNTQGISANAIEWFDIIIILIGWITGICCHELNGIILDHKIIMYQYSIHLISSNAIPLIWYILFNLMSFMSCHALDIAW